MPVGEEADALDAFMAGADDVVAKSGVEAGSRRRRRLVVADADDDASTSAAAAAVVDVPTTATNDAAQAATSTVSTRTLRVDAEQTSVAYDYDSPGARAYLTLGVWRDLPPYDAMTADELRLYARVRSAEREAALRAAGDEVLASTIARTFVADTCVVCLSEPPTMVVARCGHQCTCAECTAEMRALARTCAVCRGHVAGFIDATTLARVMGSA
jgi:hypothetical protein